MDNKDFIRDALKDIKNEVNQIALSGDMERLQEVMEGLKEADRMTQAFIKGKSIIMSEERAQMDFEVFSKVIIPLLPDTPICIATPMTNDKFDFESK